MRVLVALTIAALPLTAWADPHGSSQPRWSLPKVARHDCPGERADTRLVLRRASSLRCPADAPQPHPEAPLRQRRIGSPSRLLPPWAITGREIALRPVAAPTPRSHAPLDAGQAMALSPEACVATLEDAGAQFTRADATEVQQPIRPTQLGGVEFVIPWSTDLASDHHAIWDCRLAVALLPVAQWLAQHGVTEVHYFSALRRGAITRRKPRSQHNVGLAIDILGFVSPDFAGRIDVEDHYPRGRVGQCPPTSLRKPGWTPEAVLLANFVCAAYDWRVVHTLLTPDHDRDHENHLHLDVKPGQRRPVDPTVSFSDRGTR